jgi:AhpC/TSA family
MSTESRTPRVLERAPDFKAKSTHGVIQLSDYTSKGKYVRLFSHPSDFTPVCTTEFIEFAHHADDFERLNVQLIGVFDRQRLLSYCMGAEHRTERWCRSKVFRSCYTRRCGQADERWRSWIDSRNLVPGEETARRGDKLGVFVRVVL